MKKFKFILALMFVMVLVPYAFAGELDTLKSPAEENNWVRTTNSQEVVDYVKKVAANSEGRIRYEDMGYTVFGRPLPLAIVGVPTAPKSPAEVGNRIVIHIQCNIHSGEVEGKEASLILLREIAQGKWDDLLKDAVLLYNSNFNPDGNDALGTWRASSQPKPTLVGTRTNAQGFNLNRDFVRLASPETRAHVKLWRKWNPVIVLDEHATDGVRHRHPLNYNSGLNPNADHDFKNFNRLFMESVFGVGIGPNSDPANNYFRKYMTELFTKEPELFTDNRPPLTASVRVVPYMESYAGTAVSTIDGVYERRPTAFLAGGSESVRTTTAMPTIKNRLTLLLECHSHNEYRYRVHTQYAATISAIEHLTKQKDAIHSYLKAKDEEATNRTDATLSEWKIYPSFNGNPVSDDYDLGFGKGLITIEGYAYTKDASGDRTVNTVDPTENRVWENLECRTRFVPTSEVPMGALYILDPAAQSSVEVLLMHGVKVSRLKEDVVIPADKMLKFYNPAQARGNWTVSLNSTPYEGSAVVNLGSIVANWNPLSNDLVSTKGHYVISTAQPFGKFAAFLLEPRASDGLCYWGFWNEQLFSTENSAGGSFDIVKTSSYAVIPESALEQLVLPEDEEQAPPLKGDEIEAIFASGELPEGVTITQETMSDGSVRFYFTQDEAFVNDGVIFDGNMLADGWVLAGVDPFMGSGWKLSIVDNQIVATFSDDVDNAKVMITLLNYHKPPSNEVEVRTLWVSFSGEKEVLSRKSGGGCEIGLAILGLLAFVPFFVRKGK
ncbi:MAG: hypothetical protein FWF87_04965 [Synergistaceae bacterium]|nr:hypothetical protein [Synergistaceae bacterium]